MPYPSTPNVIGYARVFFLLFEGCQTLAVSLSAFRRANGDNLSRIWVVGCEVPIHQGEFSTGSEINPLETSSFYSANPSLFHTFLRAHSTLPRRPYRPISPHHVDHSLCQPLVPLLSHWEHTGGLFDPEPSPGKSSQYSAPWLRRCAQYPVHPSPGL